MSSDDARLLTRLSAREAQRRIRDGKITAASLLEACLDRIRALDGQLLAWTHVDEASARAAARERDAETRAGRIRGTLHGVPVGIKDIFDVAGMPTTGGARSWRHRRATKDATAVARLREAAALALGVLAGAEYDAAAGRPPRIAVSPELVARAEPEVVTHLRLVADALRAAGATLVEVTLPPSFGVLHAAGLTVLEAEAATYHEQDFRKHGPEFGKEIGAGVQAGLATTAVAYIDANRARLRFRADVAPMLAAHDALLSPTVPTPAPAGLGSTGDGSLCAPWSYSGMPSISLPSGLAASGLPFAIQLTSGAGHEQSLLRVAAWCEGVLRFSAAPTL